MIVLIIIGIVLFILALINWGQSAGHSKGLFKLFGGGNSSESSVINVNTGINPMGTTSLSRESSFGDFDLDDVYAYDDDPDYSMEF